MSINRWILASGTLLIAVILTALACTSIAPREVRDIGNNEEAGNYYTLRGIKMYCEIYGKGEPLLLVHGNGGSMADMREQAVFFAGKYKVILADSRAQGKSTDTGDSLSYEMMADDLNALLDTLKTDSCYYIGWSDGGINGLLLAMRHPNKVKKLAITGANLWPDSTAVDSWAMNWIQGTYDSLVLLPQTPEIKNQKKLTYLMPYEPHITIADLRKITCPTLVIGGDHDIIKPEHTLLIAQHLPKSYLWIMPHSGHSTLVRYKEQFNQEVWHFFTQPYKKIEGFNRL